MAAPDEIDLSNTKYYINRELSLLEFNRRVLAQAQDAAVPLLERLRFLTICSTNLDEFFEIRASGVKQQIAYGVKQPDPDGLSPAEVLRNISARAHGLVEEQYRVLNEELLPALDQEGIRILSRHHWNAKQKDWLKRYFKREVMPVLTPMGLDPAHPFPRVANKSLNFIVPVEGRDSFGREGGVAVVPVPRALPRLFLLPKSVAEGPHDFVMLSSVIHDNVGEIFPGLAVTGCYQFRVTRNSDLWVDEEEVEDLLRAIQGELQSRNFGDAVRLEVSDLCTDDMADYLLSNFDLDRDVDLYRVKGPVNLNRLAAVHAMTDRPDLKYRPFTPGQPRRLGSSRDIFETIRGQDVLLHHPYQSFNPVVELLRQAAKDPEVLAIKMTLYRTGDDSVFLDLLLEAARAGKEVTVVVELRARFDEEANINLATRLQEAGAKVVYGIVGHKAHAKMMLIVRREKARLKRYVHLGTGNYHLGTARAYTDFSLLTADHTTGEDVHKLFMQLTGLGKNPPLKKLLQSPFGLQKTLLQLIEQEADNARRGRKSAIMARMNSLSDPKMIRALYRASQAGVPVDLLVRGICCLRPGIPKVSDNVRVRSVIGRFLEHSRAFYFWADGAELTFASSADWMPRNLYSRVEACFPIEDANLRKRVLSEGLLCYFRDNTQAWTLQDDGGYRRLPGSKKKPAVSAQAELLEKLAD